MDGNTGYPNCVPHRLVELPAYGTLDASILCSAGCGHIDYAGNPYTITVAGVQKPVLAELVGGGKTEAADALVGRSSSPESLF